MPKRKPTHECFIAVLLVISKTWKQSRDTSIDEQTVVESYNRALFGDTKKMSCQATKQYGGTLHVYFSVKAISLKSLHIV